MALPKTWRAPRSVRLQAGGIGGSVTGSRGGGDQHGVLPETVSRELTQAGFTLVSSEDRPDMWFIVVAEKAVR